MPKKQNASRLTMFLCLMAILPLLAQIEEIPARSKSAEAEKTSEDVKPIMMEKPSFKTHYQAKPFTGPIDSIRLVLVSRKANKITDVEGWFKDQGLWRGEYDVTQIEKMGLPLEYAGGKLVRVIPGLTGDLLLYGADATSSRYLVAWNHETRGVGYALDFEEYLYAPEYVKADYAFIAQGLRWAQQHDDVLYVCHSHNTYAASSKGMNAYITAIDLETNKVLWRTKPLVCNTNNFEIVGDVIISGYGFTAEPDFLYLINKYNGQVIEKMKVPSGPEYIIRKDDKIYVRTYNTNLIFRIKENKIRAQ